MKINEYTSIITPRIVLVPYSAHHVPTYHEWMQDEEIQKATASEPLTIEEEYSMQRSWREDGDKLTFIICTHPGEQYYTDMTRNSQTRSITPGTQDAPANMIGDVNLFLCEDEDEDDDATAQEQGKVKSVIGELEIMVARKDMRGKGMARETLTAFMSYIQESLDDLLLEYAGRESVVVKYLRVKIDKDNVQSLSLFERVGFVQTAAVPNYFGEVELRTPVVDRRLRDVESKIGLEGFGRVVRYEVEGYGER